MATIPGQRFAGKHDNLPAETPSDTTLIPASIVGHPQKEALWTFLIEDLKARNLWSTTYLITAEEFIHCLWDLHDMRAQIERDGKMVDKVDARGNVIGKTIHPLMGAVKGWRKDLQEFISKFGLSPKDIVFLSQTDPSADQVIDVVTTDKKRIVYFRD